MKALVIGGGGREHTLVWKISQSPLVKKIFCAPGNAGMDGIAECVDIGAEDIDKLLEFAKKEKIDLTVVGPEAPLVEGIVDRFNAEGLKIFGPSADAAMLEGSKGFAKKFMGRFGIPTGTFQIFSEVDEAVDFIREMGTPIVVKADGLAAGKGVTVAFNEDEAIKAVKECITNSAFGQAGHRVVLEEFLEGEEATVLAFTDGEKYLVMPSSQDHKAAYDGDKGPNTGGMGAYSPAPVVTDEVLSRIENEIIRPTIDGLKEEGCEYRGVLYFGLMITESGPKVIEYNVRLGDPETQAVIPRMKSDIVPILLACAEGDLGDAKMEWTQDVAVCVVLASKGYPGKYEKGKAITGLKKAGAVTGAIVFHAGAAAKDGKIVTNGGRVLGATALGKDVPSAIERAYECADAIKFAGKYCRSDIGKKAIARLGKDK